jgi:hypothetical protein
MDCGEETPVDELVEVVKPVDRVELEVVEPVVD